jgi:hypothetical protein
MGKTYKDRKKKEHSDSLIRLGKKMKKEAKKNKTKFKDETNPRALKLSSANDWNYI